MTEHGKLELCSWGLIWKISLLWCLLVFVCSCTSESGPQTSKKGSALPKRIIFITIDTLRSDHLGVSGYPRDTSPFIDSLAKKGVRFTEAFSAAPHTAPSHASMFTGLFPFQHAVLRNRESLADNIPSLHRVMSDHSWSGIAFPAVLFLDGKVGFPPSPVPLGLGRERRAEKRAWYLIASEVVDHALQGISQVPSTDQLFLWLHFYDVHEWDMSGHVAEEHKRYYKMMEESGDQALLDFLAKEHNTPLGFFKDTAHALRVMNGYDSRIRFVDTEIKRLYDTLASKGLDKESLWIITADHGEGLGNHNYEGHGEFLYQEQLKVPLIFFSSEERFDSREVTELVRTVDLFPTMLELMGIKAVPPNEGRSLVPLLGNGKWQEGDIGIQFSFAERRPKDMQSFRKTWEEGEIYSLHDHEAKLIEHSHGVDEVYDLVKDRFESKNVAGAAHPAEAPLRKELEGLLKRRGSARTEAAEQVLSPDEVEELKSLGYL